MKRASMLLVLCALLVAPAADAAGVAERDPRNWPTVTRLVMDRYAIAGRVVTVRVFAKRSSYFNCGYNNASRQMAFTLLGGPLETLTGYMPREMGKLLDSVLARDPWVPITVQIRFDPDKLSDLCPDQVEILKWSLGWQYPEGTLSPGRPDPTVQPTARELDARDQGPLWDMLMGNKPRKRAAEIPELEMGDRIQLTGGARLSRAYHCVFKAGTQTHYALRLHDGHGRFVHAYVGRNDASRQLVDYIALHRNVLVSVQGKVVKQAMSHYCRPQLEVTGWSFPERERPTATGQ